MPLFEFVCKNCNEKFEKIVFSINNETIEYKVIEAEILDPYDIYNMKNSDYDLTLFTVQGS